MKRSTAIVVIAGVFILGAAMLFAGGGFEDPPAMQAINNDPMASDATPVPPPGYTEASYTKPDESDIRALLTDVQFRVSQQDGTERPWGNEYWDNKKPGIYVDIVSGEPLFSSTHKYDSGTGWPSFWQPLEAGNIVLKTDTSHGMVRTEVRSFFGDGHLGHVFTDGPQPTGLRYCMNSASMRFIPVDELEAEGYGEYLVLFGN